MGGGAVLEACRKNLGFVELARENFSGPPCPTPKKKRNWEQGQILFLNNQLLR